MKASCPSVSALLLVALTSIILSVRPLLCLTYPGSTHPERTSACTYWSAKTMAVFRLQPLGTSYLLRKATRLHTVSIVMCRVRTVHMSCLLEYRTYAIKSAADVSDPRALLNSCHSDDTPSISEQNSNSLSCCRYDSEWPDQTYVGMTDISAFRPNDSAKQDAPRSLFTRRAPGLCANAPGIARR